MRLPFLDTRRRPDFARLRRGQPSVFFTSRPGAPKRSDGSVGPEIPDISPLNQRNKIEIETT